MTMFVRGSPLSVEPADDRVHDLEPCADQTRAHRIDLEPHDVVAGEERVEALLEVLAGQRAQSFPDHGLDDLGVRLPPAMARSSAT